MKAKIKFRLNGETIQEGQEIPDNMLAAAKERGYVQATPARAAKASEKDD